MADESIVDRCESCGGEDDHPKFHVLGVSPEGLGWNTLHHDCAALLGHAKASVIVQSTNGAKGAALRKALSDDSHEVHKAVAEFSEQDDRKLEQENRRVLGLTKGGK